MSDTELPDDLQQWPYDPWALLGVTYDVSVVDLKRAYVRLARRFKPEHHPAHFQRIREAYALLEERLRMRDYFQREEFGQEATAVSMNTLADTPFAETSEAVDRLPEIWKSVCNGEWDAAYVRLLERSARRPLESDVPVGLYWLLSLFPQLDAGRSSCDWLLIPVRNSGPRGPAWELYRREIERFPKEVHHERFASLLAQEGQAESLMVLVETRWGALARLQAYPHIVQDISALRQRIAPQDEQLWVRCLFLAADYLAWGKDSESQTSFKACRLELEEMTHWHSQYSAEFSRLDLLLDLRKEIRAADSDLVNRWATLIEWGWTRPFCEVRLPLRRKLSREINTYSAALECFDILWQHSHLVVAYLGELIAQLLDDSADGEDDRTEEQFAEIVMRWVNRWGQWDYSVVRNLVLQACVSEGISIQKFAEIAVRWETVNAPFCSRLLEDVSLSTAQRCAQALYF